MIDFEKVKTDFLAHYGKTICDEARIAIEQSTTIQEAFEVLHKNMVYLTDRHIPGTDWLRKWFKEDKKTLNECGIYIDQVTILYNPQRTRIAFYGNSIVTLVLSDTQFWHLTSQDNAIVKIIGLEWSVCHLVAKGDSEGVIQLQDENAKIKIKKV